MEQISTCLAKIDSRLTILEQTCRPQARCEKRKHDDPDSDPDHHEGEKRGRTETETENIRESSAEMDEIGIESTDEGDKQVEKETVILESDSENELEDVLRVEQEKDLQLVDYEREVIHPIPLAVQIIYYHN